MVKDSVEFTGLAECHKGGHIRHMVHCCLGWLKHIWKGCGIEDNGLSLSKEWQVHLKCLWAVEIGRRHRNGI